MDITGHWSGVIIYGKGYHDYINKELYFDMEISQAGDQLRGTSLDTGGIGISPDEAIITGSLIGQRILFNKQYAISHFVNKGEIQFDKTKPGHIIEYSGLLDETKDLFSGEWRIRSKMRLFGFFPIRFTNTGTWTMRRR